MIVHIVMFAFKAENKQKNIQKAQLMLNALVGRIEGLLSMEVGVDFSASDRSMDLVLTSTYHTRADLARYATHPAHLEVVAFIKEVTEYSRVVDYEK